MPPASARIAARTAGSSSSAPARSAGACSRGRHYRVGGWGFPGFRRGQRRVARLRGGAPRAVGARRPHALDRFACAMSSSEFDGDPHAIVRWMGSATPARLCARWRRSSSSTRARTTRSACELMRLAAGHIDVLAARLGALGVPRLALAGGLSSSMAPWLSRGDEAPPGPRRGRCARRCSAARAGTRPSPAMRDELIAQGHCRAMAEAGQDRPDVTMAREIREAPAAVSRQQQRLAQPLGGARRAAQAPAAAGGRHLRARQLGPCGDLRQAPDRALYRHSRRRGRAQHRQRLRPGDCASRTSCFSPSRNRDEATISSR